MLIVGSREKEYPELLKEIADFPRRLYYHGDLSVAKQRCVAIVGTRKATAVGRETARRFARELAAAGLPIVSGLALGVDTAAHEGALEASGRTIAVLGNGIDWVYPRQNKGLAERILETGGALVSEYPPGTDAFPSNFLARNRIVSGLASGIIIIEAPRNSGSLVTANFALEQNREVFVVPGPLNHENYIGSHDLIRAGARLVAKPEDVLEDLGLASAAAEQKDASMLAVLNDEQRKIYQALREAGEAVSVDKIHEITKMEVSAIGRNLTPLLIKSIIKEEGGRYFL